MFSSNLSYDIVRDMNYGVLDSSHFGWCLAFLDISYSQPLSSLHLPILHYLPTYVIPLHVYDFLLLTLLPYE